MLFKNETSSSPDVLKDLQVTLSELIEVLRNGGLSHSGKIKFNITERDEAGRIKSFEIDRQELPALKAQ